MCDVSVPCLTLCTWFATCSCEDEEKVRVVQVVGRRIEKLSVQLVECAGTVAQAMAKEDGQPDQTVQEDTEILRRDWSSQVWEGEGLRPGMGGG